MTGRETDAWRFWIDRGGTFTDIVAQRDGDTPTMLKLLSDNPDAYADASIAGIRRLLGLGPESPIPAGVIAEVKMGTTVATNALLERKGDPVVLVVTRGFGDLLAIGRQARPRLFDLNIRKPAPLPMTVIEVDGRVTPQGQTLVETDFEAAEADLVRARQAGATACAIALLHAWKQPHEERAVADIARRVGFAHVSLSHEVSPTLGYYGRATTTVIDAYLSPVLRRYVAQVADGLGDTPLYFMQSGGGLVEAGGFGGKDSILSGPAGGIVGMARTAEADGYSKVVGFDMGGTSTDVSVYDGAFERVYETEVAGVPLSVPMLDIHTVAAGGGSILSINSGRLRVGPASAGSVPGPAAYRRGGPATVTDANVVLGRVTPDHFPAVFGPSGDQPLDVDAAERVFADLSAQYRDETGTGIDPRDLAEAFLAVAVSNMARAIKHLTTDRGRDLKDFALQSFGGAGGQHACSVADALGIDRVLVHPFAGVLSALGIGLADERDVWRASVEVPLSDRSVARAAGNLAERAQARAEALGDGATVTHSASLRYVGTDTALAVRFGSLPEMVAAFEAAHTARFGFATPGREIILSSLTSEAVKQGAALGENLTGGDRNAGAPPLETAEVWMAGRPVRAGFYQRRDLSPGWSANGPAIIVDPGATMVIDPGWRCVVAQSGALVVSRQAPASRPALSADAGPDPLHLELFNNRFMAIAERMGAVLRDTATSVNIKERLDFSCALFDANGGLIANAPHMPVHLGAMGESVRAVLASRRGTLNPGDMIALNNPFNGGTHLPDVTVVAPVFDTDERTIRFFVGNRGHHADIGGVTPGSTPPHATALEEEGVVIDDFLISDGGAFREAAFRALLSNALYPARNPDTNVSDIRAQIAANRAGIAEVAALLEADGWPLVSAYAGHVMDNAEESVRRVIDRLESGATQYPLDDGSVICVAVEVDRAARSAVIDFTGTSPQRPGNFNAPPAVSRAAVLYVFRCLVDDDLPLNEGCLRPLRLVVPEGSLLSPAEGAAVVAGNTEISQALCNALFLAMGAMAASQGTMNNLLLGNGRVQYYETLCGGSGAGPDFAGADAVHTHMTNTRITDPEVLEERYPMRVHKFAVRCGSGGHGSLRGGHGAVREIEALEPMTLSFVSSSRIVSPPGLSGGGAGAPGEQWIIRTDGRREALEGVASAELGPGDRIVIATPGGGGWGPPTAD